MPDIIAGHLAVLQERARTGSLTLTLFDSMTEAHRSWSERNDAMARRLLEWGPPTCQPSW
jgi:hypothetical protein